MTVASSLVGHVPPPSCLAYSQSVQRQLAATSAPGSRSFSTQLRPRQCTAPAWWQRQAGGLLAVAAGGGEAMPALPAGGLAAWPPTARVALRTGVYITSLGLAVLVAPVTTFGLLFDARCGGLHVRQVRRAHGWVLARSAVNLAI